MHTTLGEIARSFRVSFFFFAAILHSKFKTLNSKLTITHVGVRRGGFVADFCLWDYCAALMKHPPPPPPPLLSLMVTAVTLPSTMRAATSLEKLLSYPWVS